MKIPYIDEVIKVLTSHLIKDIVMIIADYIDIEINNGIHSHILEGWNFEISNSTYHLSTSIEDGKIIYKSNRYADEDTHLYKLFARHPYLMLFVRFDPRNLNAVTQKIDAYHMINREFFPHDSEEIRNTLKGYRDTIRRWHYFLGLDLETAMTEIDIQTAKNAFHQEPYICINPENKHGIPHYMIEKPDSIQIQFFISQSNRRIKIDPMFRYEAL